MAGTPFTWTSTDVASLDFIRAFVLEEHRTPSLREMAAAWHMTIHGAHCRLLRLERHGEIERRGLRNAFRLTRARLAWLDERTVVRILETPRTRATQRRCGSTRASLSPDRAVAGSAEFSRAATPRVAANRGEGK